MKKFFTFSSPILFSAFSYLAYIMVFIINNFVEFKDYGGLGLAFLIIFLWVLIIIPIYCYLYYRLIRNNRLKFIFAIYNPLVIASSYTLPFFLQGEYFIIIFQIAMALLVWSLIWCLLPLFIKPKQNNEDIIKQEPADFLLQSKKKNIIAICFTCPYIIYLITTFPSWWYGLFSFLTSFLTLLSPCLFVIFVLLKNKQYPFEKWILPFALLSDLFCSLISIYLSLSNMDIQMKFIPLYPVIFVFSCLKTLFLAAMFTGTLFNFKHIKLLKYSALGYFILSVGLLVFNLLNVGGVAYQKIDLNGTLAINISFVITSLISILYYVGIFILTSNKKSSESV